MLTPDFFHKLSVNWRIQTNKFVSIIIPSHMWEACELRLVYRCRTGCRNYNRALHIWVFTIFTVYSDLGRSLDLSLDLFDRLWGTPIPRLITAQEWEWTEGIPERWWRRHISCICSSSGLRCWCSSSRAVVRAHRNRKGRCVPRPQRRWRIDCIRNCLRNGFSSSVSARVSNWRWSWWCRSCSRRNWSHSRGSSRCLRLSNNWI